MTNFKRITLLASLVFALGSATQTHAKADWIKLDRMDLFIDNQPGWYIKEKLLGMPLVLVSKAVNGQRSSLSFTPSNHQDVAASTIEDFKNQFEMYQSGRSKWLKDREGKLVKFIEPKVHSFKHTSAGIVGMEYTLNDNIFVEYSINIFCEKRFIFSKLLYSKKDHPNAYESALGILKALKCRSKM